MMVEEEDEAAGQVGYALARKGCTGFLLVKYTNTKYKRTTNLEDLNTIRGMFYNKRNGNKQALPSIFNPITVVFIASLAINKP